MKLTRILALPFAAAADLATLGNMGGRSFTQQVFDAERQEREVKLIVEVVRAIGPLVKSTNHEKDSRSHRD